MLPLIGPALKQDANGLERALCTTNRQCSLVCWTEAALSLSGTRSLKVTAGPHVIGNALSQLPGEETVTVVTAGYVAYTRNAREEDATIRLKLETHERSIVL